MNCFQLYIVNFLFTVVVLTSVPTSKNEDFHTRNCIQVSVLKAVSGLLNLWFTSLRWSCGPGWLVEFNCNVHTKEGEREEPKSLFWNHQPIVLTSCWLPFSTWETGTCIFSWAHCI